MVKKSIIILMCLCLAFISFDNDKKLQLSQDDKVVFGVCGGLGEYFDIDPKLIRIGFVIFSLAGGSGILVYIVAAIIMS